MQCVSENELKYDAFYRDDLGMKDYATNIVNIIQKCDMFPKSNDNNAYVIGIDASWGSGKTYFDNLLIEFISDNKKLLHINTIYYDAWSNDFWDNAFEPFFSQIINSSIIDSETIKSDMTDILKSAAKIIALGIKGFALKKIEDYFDIGTVDDILDECKKIWDNASDEEYQVSKYFKEFANFVKAISVLKSFLQYAVKKSGGKTVIFIDELDRCKPTFAIQTLEIVKHLFNVEGLIFVFSLDLEQLSYCVQSVYGEKIDAIGYLERFFNFITTLPRLDYAKIAKQYTAEFCIQYKNDNFIQSVVEIGFIFNLSLRDLRTVLSSLYILQQTSIKKYCFNDDAMVLYLYFLAMKYKYPTYLNNAIQHKNVNDLSSFINTHEIPFLFANEKIYLDSNMLVRKIGSVEFQLIRQSDERYQWLNKVRMFCGGDNMITLTDESGVPILIQSNENLEFVLYFEDIHKLSEIQHLSILEYVYKNLEMCGFVNE